MENQKILTPHPPSYGKFHTFFFNFDGSPNFPKLFLWDVHDLLLGIIKINKWSFSKLKSGGKWPIFPERLVH